MLNSSTNKANELHPLLKSISEKIRFHRSGIVDLISLPMDAEFEFVQGNLDGQVLSLTNEMHSCPGIRKIHLELAIVGNRLQILHGVFYPDPRYDLPIFGTDVVCGPSGVTAAILDLSPVRSDIPEVIKTSLLSISRPSFQNVRDLPDWGYIFSPYVHFIRPSSFREQALFTGLVDGYLKIFVNSLKSTTPDAIDSLSTIERSEGQLEYCQQQKRNDKTRRVLAKAFNPKWADHYMEKVLFDFP